MGEKLPGGPGGGARLRSDTSSRPGQTLRVKMVLLGSSGVGKSSLALRFATDEFRSTSPTVGCAYLTRAVHLSDATLRFEIWDTAGSEKYHSVTPLYYRGAHAALLVYDVSQREGRRLADDRGLLFTETSALSGDQVPELLLAVAHRVQECTAVQRGGLPERTETPHVDLRRRDTISPLGSCCTVGP
ncbi:Ras-related protein Rab-5C [Liparis tanakae]|uniref:Ras-related protein Rab-5C n=1 Tax=Liparis tanakae TaxID=230148 RepID=A0A4Z2G8R7_9TELE|nr:Ras-related protein Rab-5C [Liparis tanakae]